MAVSRINEAGLNVNQFGNRNLIINGGMQVAQRSTSETALGADTNTYRTHDRWKIKTNGTAGRFTMAQSTDAPSGFTNSLKFSCTTADTSIAAAEEFRLTQHIEAGSCARTMTGTSDAKQITLSFYAKADSTKTYVAQILNNKHSSFVHNNRTFTVTSSWQRFTMTFQADTDTDSKFDGTQTDAGFSLSFWLHAGSNYTSATLASDWATGTTNRAAGTQSFFSATSNTFFITGCQLEVGDTATDFEHRSYGDELLQCQRYYQEMNIVNYPLQAYLAADHYSQIRFSPPLRAAATGTLVSTAIYFTGFDRTSGTTATGTGGYKDGLTLRVQGASGVNIGEAGLIVCTGKFDAEL